MGNSKTVMISCISPGSYSVEHTLNTLRYADRYALAGFSNIRELEMWIEFFLLCRTCLCCRVKSLSKTGIKKESAPVPPPSLRDIPPGLLNLQLLQGHPNASQIEAFVEAALAASATEKIPRPPTVGSANSSGELLDFDLTKDRLGRPPQFDSKWSRYRDSEPSQNRSLSKIADEAMEVDVALEKPSMYERDSISNHALSTLDDNAPSVIESFGQLTSFDDPDVNCGMNLEDDTKGKGIGKPPKYLRRTSSVSSMPPSSVENPANSLNGEKVESEDDTSAASGDGKKGENAEHPKLELTRRRQPPRRVKSSKPSRTSASVETFDDLVASSQDNSSAQNLPEVSVFCQALCEG